MVIKSRYADDPPTTSTSIFTLRCYPVAEWFVFDCYCLLKCKRPIDVGAHPNHRGYLCWFDHIIYPFQHDGDQGSNECGKTRSHSLCFMNEIAFCPRNGMYPVSRRALSPRAINSNLAYLTFIAPLVCAKLANFGHSFLSIELSETRLLWCMVVCNELYQAAIH